MSRGRARLAAAFGVWLVTCVVAWFFGNAPRPGVVAMYVAVASALVWLFLDVSADTEVTRWPGVREEPVREPGEDPRLGQLRRVVAHHLDGREVGDVLHRRLTALADQRLMARHSVTREADPELAARLLGPDLLAVTTAHPPYPRLTTAQIEQLLQRIETL